MQTHSYLNKCSKAEAWSCVPKPCSAWAAQAAGRERSRNLLISQGEHIRIPLEEGNKAGVSLPPFCPGEFSTAPADTKHRQLRGSSSSGSAAPGCLGMGGSDLAGHFGNGSQEDTDTT